jgi:two-component system chemotaxis sensor kinase CheA
LHSKLIFNDNPMTRSHASEQTLFAIFASEARVHLAQIGTSLDALERAGGAAPVALLDPIRDALHTLKGAARAVELYDLEYLCHALEKVFHAARAGAALAPAQWAVVRHAVELAGVLADKPGGRSRSQALGQLDLLARELAARTSSASERQPHPVRLESKP